jgi:outer membrane biosynthesis protein TonB
MTKQVSPAFAAIVIIVALALGALYFMVRYRQHEAREEAIAQAAERTKEAAIRSGRYGQGRQMRSGSRPGRSGAPGAEAPEAAPGAETPEAAPGDQPEPAPEAAER